MARARNNGWRRAETPYVLFLDADDRLVPGALALLRAPLEADSDARLRIWPDEVLRRLGGRAPLSAVRPVRASVPAHDRALRARPPGAPRGHRRVRSRFRQFEDWELWVNALAHGWRGLPGRRGDRGVPSPFELEARSGPACVPRSVPSPQGEALGALSRARPPCRREQPRLIGPAPPPRVLGPETGARFRRAGPLPLALAEKGRPDGAVSWLPPLR